MQLAARRRAPLTPETWRRNTYGEEPDYSAVLEKLAHTQQERRALLQRYFEPSEENREEGRRLPTRAHHAIAELIAKGCVNNVILTTNFDRLMEPALEEYREKVSAQLAFALADYDERVGKPTSK